MMLPLCRAVMQIVFCKTALELSHCCFHLFSQHKIGSFEHGFYLWKKEEVTESKIMRTRGVIKHSNVFMG
jgi:hypothetical protein